VFAVAQATPDFSDYLEGFPHRPLGKKILFVESCHPSLVSKTRTIWEPTLPEKAEVHRISESTGKPERALLKAKRFDSAVVFFSGESGLLPLKVLPFLLGIREIAVINENGHYFYANLKSLTRFLIQRVVHGQTLPKPLPQVLMIQSDTAENTGLAVQKLREKHLFPDSEIVLACRESDKVQLSDCKADRLVTFKDGETIQNLRTLRKLRQEGPEVVATSLVPKSGYTLGKALFPLFLDRPLLAFNSTLDCYFIGPRTLPLTLRDDVHIYSCPRILMIQTEGWQYIDYALRQLRENHLFPAGEVTLLCREQDSQRFQNHDGIDHLITFSKKDPSLAAVRKQIRQFSPQIISAVFSGRPVFRKQKLLFFLFGRRPKLVFNAQLDCYWLTLKTLRRVFQKEPLRFETVGEGAAEALLIQTENDRETLEALDLMVSEGAIPQQAVSILCAEDKRKRFEVHPAIANVYGYRPGRVTHNARLLGQLLARNWDVVAALLTGQSIYRFQKLLFFLLPARHRLVFNENGDCYYRKRGRVARALKLPSFPAKGANGSSDSLDLEIVEQVFRSLMKAVLFVPRFAFLMSWLTVAKLKRSYHLQTKN